MTKKILCKILGTLLVLMGLVVAMFVLLHPAKNGFQTTEIVPEIVESPVYVECEEGVSLEVSIHAKETFRISGIQLLLVNISSESRGTVQIAVMDSSSNLLTSQVLPVETITPGKWFVIPADIIFDAGEDYLLTILPDGSTPYFMQVLDGGGENLPFEESVSIKDVEAESGISLGVNVVTEKKITYGEIFYYSIPLCVLTVMILIVGIWFGFQNMWKSLKKIPFKKFFERFGNDLFLFLLFGAICVSVFYRAYLKGVYISSDSAGYLREAVNLAGGNGFHYDKMAGYDSWFANWPIFYPAMIAFVMMITKTNAYLASKLLTMLLVGIILIVIRLCYKKDAWFYALCLTNIGFLNLAYYTWSEIPFMLFLFCFALTLAKILEKEDPQWKWYVLLGVLGLCVFLTRYFGIYVWMVVGIYILYLLWQYYKKRNKNLLKKAAGLTITAFGSGVIGIVYLFMNKLMSGMASGVSRTLWWDDYEKLTNDLIESLLTEIFNVFSMQIPELIESFPYHLKVIVLVTIIGGIIWFVANKGKWFSREMVMITLAVSYYLIFIAIRYVSSMDTFYFRFFEPASFLLCLGLMGLLLPQLQGKKGFHYFAGVITVVMFTAVLAVFDKDGMNSENLNGGYYSELAAQWDDAYEGIPKKSVVIFNDIDFRSSWYRPDVVEGIITPEDTLETIRATYYGSDYLCIRVEFAEVMLESGEYHASIQEWMQDGMKQLTGKDKFLVLPLDGQ